MKLIFKIFLLGCVSIFTGAWVFLSADNIYARNTSSSSKVVNGSGFTGTNKDVQGIFACPDNGYSTYKASVSYIERYTKADSNIKFTSREKISLL